MSFFRKLAEKNDNKHDLLLTGLYFVFMLASLGLAVFFLLFEPGRMSVAMVENVIYVIKISLTAALCLFALYCFIRAVSTIITMIKRKPIR